MLPGMYKVRERVVKTDKGAFAKSVSHNQARLLNRFRGSVLIQELYILADVCGCIMVYPCVYSYSNLLPASSHEPLVLLLLQHPFPASMDFQEVVSTC